jgi:hypothetical protein
MRNDGVKTNVTTSILYIDPTKTTQGGTYSNIQWEVDDNTGDSSNSNVNGAAARAIVHAVLAQTLKFEQDAGSSYSLGSDSGETYLRVYSPLRAPLRTLLHYFTCDVFKNKDTCAALKMELGHGSKQDDYIYIHVSPLVRATGRVLSRKIRGLMEDVIVLK